MVLFAWGEVHVLELMLASFEVVNCLPIYEAMMLRKDDARLPKRVFFFFSCLLLGCDPHAGSYCVKLLLRQVNSPVRVHHLQQ